jgi:NADPH:quinone reductase-like Zn-dependent oxidoreductase
MLTTPRRAASSPAFSALNARWALRNSRNCSQTEVFELSDRPACANLDGMLAVYAVLSEEALVHMPSHLSFEEGATLPCAAVTAPGGADGTSPGNRR